MPAANSLNAVFGLKNLRLAWDRILLDHSALYKNYFRESIASYSLALEKNLGELSRVLLNGSYEPSAPSYVYFPKKSGLLRKYTLLTLRDQIVYQSIANIVAEVAGPKLATNYSKKSFAYQLHPRVDGPFYQDYRALYDRFGGAIRKAHNAGNEYIASFDLVSFFDSIDHHVLKQSLEHLKVAPEVCDFLERLLRKWTEAQVKSSVLSQGHGIPQGPLASPIFGEIVLHRFDKLFEKESSIVYLRYVDDIKLMAKSEQSVRRELIRLDFVSKMLGLFPQSAKTNVHRITSISKELNSISDVIEIDHLTEPGQRNLYSALLKITPRGKVLDEKRVKFILHRTLPSSRMNSRVIRLLKAHPHLYQLFIEYLRKTKFLTHRQSQEILNYIDTDHLYYSVTAQLVNLLRVHGSRKIQNELSSFCTRRQQGKGKSYSELIFALTAHRLSTGTISWADLEKVLSRSNDWWSTSQITRLVSSARFGQPTVSGFLFEKMKHQNVEVALGAADNFLRHDFELDGRQSSGLAKKAQILLRENKKIRSVRDRACFVKGCFDQIVFRSSSAHNWKRFFGAHYRPVLEKMQRWKAYQRTDPTSWVNLSDVIFDFILDRLFAQDGGIGTYTFGNPGGVLYSSTSQFALQYPKTFLAAKSIHQLRLESDLSHPQIKATKKYTRYIRHKEIQRILLLMKRSFSELKAAGLL